MIPEIIGIIIAVIIIFVLFKIFKSVFMIILNSIIGFFSLYAVNLVLSDPIPINFWSVIIVAIGGIFGLIIELILHFLRVAF